MRGIPSFSAHSRTGADRARASSGRGVPIQTAWALDDCWMAGTTLLRPIRAPLIIPQRTGSFALIVLSISLDRGQHHLDRLAVFDQVVGFLPILDGEAVGDHRSHLDGAG